MISSAIFALIHLQTPVPANATFADETYKLTVGVIGELGTPMGVIKNPMLAGDLILTSGRALDKNRDMLQVRLKLKRKQSAVIEAITETFSPNKVDGDGAVGMYKEGEDANFVSSLIVDKLNTKIAIFEDNSPASEVINPLGIAVAVFQRALTGPQLRKEFLLIDIESKLYYATFKENLNANTDASKGEAAYKFFIRLKDNGEDYSNYINGAVRLNVKTKTLTYLNATLLPEDGPTAPDDATFKPIKSVGFQIRAREKK